MNNKRIETFVFEFDNQEAFSKFWGEYCHLDKELNNGVKWIGAAIGNKLKEEDSNLGLIGDLYDVAARHITGNKEIEILQKAEKILGI